MEGLEHLAAAGRPASGDHQRMSKGQLGPAEDQQGAAEDQQQVAGDSRDQQRTNMGQGDGGPK